MTSKPYIFVTVGSTDFDALIKAVDNLVPTLQLEGIMQIGHGQYVPRHMPYIRFAPSLDPYYEQASLVVSHGGGGTVTEVLQRGLPLVSVSNPDRYDQHQDDILATLAKENYLVWCRCLDDLKQAIETAQTQPLRLYQQPACQIHLVIHEFLKTHTHHSGEGELAGQMEMFHSS